MNLRVIRIEAGRSAWKLRMITLVALGCACLAPRADAQIVITSTWLADIAAGPGNWSTAINWTAVPQSGSKVVINNGIIFPASVNQDVDAAISELTLGSGAMLAVGPGRSLALTGNGTNNGTLTVLGGGTFTVQSGTLTNTGGTIAAFSGSTVAISNATVTAGNITTSGTGVLRLSDANLAVVLSNSATGIVRAVSGVNTVVGAYIDAAGSQMRIDNGAKILVPTGTAAVTINGGIFLDSSGADTVLEIGAASLTLNGGGKIVLSNNANNRIIGSNTSTSMTFGPNFTVQGAGQIGNGLLTFTNQGSIIADQSTSLLIKPSAAGFSNSGTLRATNGGTLGLQDGPVNNTNTGAIVADNGSHVDISASTVTGGTLTSTGTGHFHALNSSTLSGLTISTGSTVEVGDGQALNLMGNIINDGVIALLSTGSSTDLKIDSSVTLGGIGNVTLSDSSFNRIYTTTSGASLTIGANQTISGSGQIGANALSLINQGTVAATGTNALVINNSGSTFTNAGTLKSSGTGGLTLADATVTNQGSLFISAGSAITAAGTFTQTGASSALNLSSGTFSSNNFALQGGSLGGTGTVDAPVIATGTATIVPGGAGTIGTLTFNQTLTLGSTNGLYFDLGGTAPGTGYDRINGTNIILNGSLFLSFVNGFQFTIAPTDTLTLISTSAALSGTFSSLANGSRLTTLDGFGSFQVNYLSSALTLSNFQAVPEPSTYALLGLGLVAVAMAELRRRRA